MSASSNARRRERNTQIIEDQGFIYESFNNGAHLRIEGIIDFWPGTEKFQIKKTGKWGRAGKYGRGIDNVLRIIDDYFTEKWVV